MATESQVARDRLGQGQEKKRTDLDSGQQLFLVVLITTSQEAMISAVVVIGEHARTDIAPLDTFCLDRWKHSKRHSSPVEPLPSSFPFRFFSLLQCDTRGEFCVSPSCEPKPPAVTSAIMLTATSAMYVHVGLTGEESKGKEMKATADAIQGSG